MKKNLSRFISLFLLTGTLSIFLTGCFSFSNSSSSKTSNGSDLSNIYENADFTITIPKTWEVIEKKDFTSEVPADTQVVFRNNVKNETYTANVNILKPPLLNIIDTAEYAKTVNNRQKYGLINYVEKRNDPYKIKIGGKDTDSFFREFDGKTSPSENSVRYFQTYGVKSINAFIVTGSMSPKDDANAAKTLEDIVKSFTLK